MLASIASDPPESGFEPYAADVYGWAYRLLGRHHDALDVVQDVFVKWAQQCARQQPQHPRGWLRRVTLNRAIDKVRVRRHGSLESDEAIAGLTHPAEAPGQSIDQVVLRDDITQALDRLTDSQRSVLVAKIYDGLTFARIGEELGLAVSTVKTQYLRALDVVRAQLRPRWDDQEKL
ncbi:MAG: RNA polymerase sigma factor [Planctomycetes bacterium]|nr:RNA polymerase sigma factor [Planctomycetota bacterium]